LIRRRGQQQQAEAGPSNVPPDGNLDATNEGEQNGEPSIPAGDVRNFFTVVLIPFSHARPKAVPDSDHLDSEDEAPAGKKRKLSKVAMEKRKAGAKKKAIKFDDDDYDGEEDAYTALSKSLRTNKSSDSKPSVGSRVKCAKCSNQFTMVRFRRCP
jgi:hypothetical protein